MIQFHFGHRQVIGIDTQISGKESLNIPFSLYTAANGRIIFVSVGYKFQRRMPVTIKSHTVKKILQAIQVYISLRLKFLQQILIILLAHIVVGNTQYHPVATGSDKGQHAVIKEQAGKYLGFGQFISRKGVEQAGQDSTLFGDLTEHPLAVTVQTVQADEVLHLVVVRLGVGINHVLGRLTGLDAVTKIVKHHIAIEHLRITL